MGCSLVGSSLPGLEATQTKRAPHPSPSCGESKRATSNLQPTTDTIALDAASPTGARQLISSFVSIPNRDARYHRSCPDLDHGR